MPRTVLHLTIFLLGLLAVCWIGIGYVATHPLGAAVAALIALCYLVGGVELLRYRQATHGLRAALAHPLSGEDGIAAWLQRVPEALRTAVRQRVAGERVALPGPALTSYLVGLLVLLGMLGTLLGMMATLRGTGLALESATDLQAIRGSLASPVQGLAVAFGTSIAGVATSAMLGLLAALLRRERQQVVQQLDARIAGDLHPHSQAWQREQSLQLQQAQADALPALVERLQAMSTALEQHSAAAQAQLASSQAAFLERTEALQLRLAEQLQQALRDGMDASARAVGAALQPMAEGTLAGLATQAEGLHARVGEAVQLQLQGLSDGFARSQAATEASWVQALADQRAANAGLGDDLRSHLQAFGERHETQARGVLDAVAAQLAEATHQQQAAWTAAAEQQHRLNTALVERQAQALDAGSARLDTQAQGLVEAMAARHDTLQQQLQAQDAQRQADWQAAMGQLQQAHAALQATLESHEQQRQQHWQQALDTVQQSHDGLQERLQAGDQARLDRWREAIDSMATGLTTQWRDQGDALAAQHQQVCQTLARTAQEIGEQSRAQATATLGEVTRLLQVAADAPRAAAEVVAELRHSLSESLVRDNAMLEERGRLLETVQTLLDAVNHAAREQRGAVDALVGTSAELLERVGTRFTDHISAETGKLDGLAAQLGAGAADVASLAEGFGAAVHGFGTATAELSGRLEQVGSALDASLARSDEQLAYYVAQAREVVDLSLLSQKQVLDELQQLAQRRAGKATSA